MSKEGHRGDDDFDLALPLDWGVLSRHPNALKCSGLVARNAKTMLMLDFSLLLSAPWDGSEVLRSIRFAHGF
jgi:hypothetical protein